MDSSNEKLKKLTEQRRKNEEKRAEYIRKMEAERIRQLAEKLERERQEKLERERQEELTKLLEASRKLQEQQPGWWKKIFAGETAGAQQRTRETGESNTGLEKKVQEQGINLNSSTDMLTESQRRIKELEQKNADQEKELSSSTIKLKGSRQKIQELEQKNKELEEKIREQRNKHEETPGLLCYKMNSRPRGMCLIINNVNFFTKTQNRKGAQFDERGLKYLFNELSFTVSVRQDLKRDEMLKVAADFAKEDHSQFDAFVFIVMSHGRERDVIDGVDEKEATIEELMSKFKAPNCPTLRNKPKLFFIQACRGSQNESTSATSYYPDSCVDALTTDSTLPRSLCPQEADFVLAFCTAPGYVAWRNQQSGSWFVQTLVEVIRKRHFHDHLLDMLTEVNRLVAERGQSAAGSAVQVPAPVHTLRAKLYL